jgi:predicted DNA-binding protein
MIVTDEGIEIPAADEVAAIIEGRGESSYVGNTKVISVRLPKHLAAKIQALSHKSGKTRNAMLCNLLEVGVEEVRKRLKPETLAQLQELEAETLDDQDQAGEV